MMLALVEHSWISLDTLLFASTFWISIDLLFSQIDKYYPQTAGIIFMIDGTNYNVKDISEYVF